VDFTSDDALDFRKGIAAGLGHNVVDVSLLLANAHSNKISVPDRPDSFVLHVDHLELAFLCMMRF
jgi:hypothetical protein